MSNIQYIGARYVPIVYTNPDDNSANWKSGVVYEPLTIVTYNGDSYTSKKAVPDLIGNPASNPDYWVKTGDFNASLIALQNRVNDIDNVKIPAINDAITEINGRPRYIFIGDSYGNGYPHTVNDGWIAVVKTRLLLTEGVNAFSYAHNRYGFVGEEPQGFNDLLNQAISDITDHDSITDVVVCGGYNDIGKAGVASAIAIFIQNVQNNFPNAKVTIGFCASMNTFDASLNNALDALQTQYVYETASGNYRFVGHLYNIIEQNPSFLNPDGVHPTVNGYKELGNEIARILRGSHASDVFPVRTASFTPATGFSWNGSAPTIEYRRSSHSLRLWFSSFIMDVSGITGYMNNFKSIGTLSNIIVNPLYDGDKNIITIPALARVNSVNVPITLYINIRHDLTVNVCAQARDYSNNYLMWTNCDQIVIEKATFALPIGEMIY